MQKRGRQGRNIADKGLVDVALSLLRLDSFGWSVTPIFWLDILFFQFSTDCGYITFYLRDIGSCQLNGGCQDLKVIIFPLRDVASLLNFLNRTTGVKFGIKLKYSLETNLKYF